LLGKRIHDMLQFRLFREYSKSLDHDWEFWEHIPILVSGDRDTESSLSVSYLATSTCSVKVVPQLSWKTVAWTFHNHLIKGEPLLVNNQLIFFFSFLKTGGVWGKEGERESLKPRRRKWSKFFFFSVENLSTGY